MIIRIFIEAQACGLPRPATLMDFRKKGQADHRVSIVAGMIILIRISGASNERVIYSAYPYMPLSSIVLGRTYIYNVQYLYSPRDCGGIVV